MQIQMEGGAEPSLTEGEYWTYGLLQDLQKEGATEEVLKMNLTYKRCAFRCQIFSHSFPGPRFSVVHLLLLLSFIIVL